MTEVAVAGKGQTNHISDADCDYFTTLLHFPGQIIALEVNVQGYLTHLSSLKQNSEFKTF